MAAAQNPRSLVSLLDKNTKQRADGGLRQRTHDPAALPKHSSFIQVVNGQRDDMPKQSAEHQQQILLERYVAAGTQPQQEQAEAANHRLR
jgi:hypothetical protein